MKKILKNSFFIAFIPFLASFVIFKDTIEKISSSSFGGCFYHGFKGFGFPFTALFTTSCTCTGCQDVISLNGLAVLLNYLIYFVFSATFLTVIYLISKKRK